MKQILYEGLGVVTFRSSTRAKRLILKFDKEGQPLVVVPRLMPFLAARQYVKKNLQWFIANRPVGQTGWLQPNQLVGRDHQLIFKPTDKNTTSSRVGEQQIVISYPKTLVTTDTSVQDVAKKAATRALKRQAELYLPSRLHTVAAGFGYQYKSVSVRAMHSRWGSCSTNKTISLSIWLMQLSDELIDYVLCHELTHLNHHHHQPAFWQELSEMIPDYKQRRKQLKSFQPRLLLNS